MISFICRIFILSVALIAFEPSARAQYVLEDGAFTSTTEGWINGSGALSTPTDNRRSGAAGFGFGDAGVRELALYQFAPQVQIGARLVVTGNTNDDSQLEEASAVAQGDWGRLEVGRRQGLPDVLLGYSPNPYTFTSTEFGPKSGVTLEPGGGLPLQFLKSDLSRRISALNYLGYSTALFDDRSVKAVYVSPRLSGWAATIAFAPDTATAPSGASRNYDNLVQSAISYQVYNGQDTYHFGASYSYAQGNSQVLDLYSVNGGASLELGNRFQPGSTTILGVNVSTDADTGYVRGGFHSTGFGVTSSANYEIGPWIFGGYYQYAEAQGDVTRDGNDTLKVLEIGTSYRFSTRLRIFNAAYFYDFNNGNAISTTSDGSIFILGLRRTF